MFQIKDTRWADYWLQLASPVMLVVRGADGEFRWMNVTDHLRCVGTRGTSTTEILFTGDRLDVMSVRAWRDRLMARSRPQPT
jgi:hypothetical protein